MKRLSFTLDIVPPKATAQQKGAFVVGGRVRFFKKSSVRNAENLLAAMLEKHAPPEPFDGPVRLYVHWTFPYRKSEKRSLTSRAVCIRHTVRPDLDNLEKSLLDVMTALGFWRDDSQIVFKQTAKSWWCVPSIYIEIAEVEPTFERRD